MSTPPKFRGVDVSQEVDTLVVRPDVRPLRIRFKGWMKTTDGVLSTCFAFPILAFLLCKIPFSGELIVALMAAFYWAYVRTETHLPVDKRSRRFDFPFRVPFMAKALDGSYPNKKLGDGITYLGKEVTSNLEIWSGNSDLRTHMLVLGTTGSGKTELLLGLVYNALTQNSGVIYTDGKGDVSLFNNVFRLARYLGRENDLLTINFLTSGRDFLGKQLDKTTNTMNPFALGSSGMLIELIISLMDDAGGGGDMWKGRAIAFVAGLTRALAYLRDKGYLLLDANKFMQYFELPVIERLVWDKVISEGGTDITINDPLFEKVLSPLKDFILTLPGYKRESKGNQEQKTGEQHGFIVMQLTRLFGDMSYTYGYLFQTSLGEVDMYDVVINRRILVVLLPALERAPDSLKMLGKLIVGAIKQMMAGCLGNRLEGAVREIVKARPTNAAVPFYCILDEYGYYAVLGFAVAPAQARSLGFPQPLGAKVKVRVPGSGDSYKRMSEMSAGDLIVLPDDTCAPLKETVETGVLPCSVLRTASGATVESANVHAWPVRVNAVQHRVATVLEIKELQASGLLVELSTARGGHIKWSEIVSVEDSGVQETRCIVVDHPMHCYLTDHDVVTHNCIVFAAQDFSSLQKASKEEADATWENTNVRAVGRITSGRESETFRRIAGLAGETTVYEAGARERKTGVINDSYKTSDAANLTKVSRIEFDDLARQADGEFTFLIGKKESGGKGRVRVIRARSFYTQVDFKDKQGKKREFSPPEIRVNHFIKVAPPRNGNAGDDADLIDSLEKHFSEMLSSGKLASVFPNDPLTMVNAKAPQPLLQMALYLRRIRSGHQVTLGEAARVALVCVDKEVLVDQRRAEQAAASILQSAATESSQSLSAMDLDDGLQGIPSTRPTAQSPAGAPQVSSEGSMLDGYGLMPDEVPAEGKQAAGGGSDSKSGGAKSGGGLPPVLENKPLVNVAESSDYLDGEIGEFPDGRVAPENDDAAEFETAGSFVRSFLADDDEDEFDSSSPRRISVLTGRSLEEGAPENEASQALAGQIADMDLMIGDGRDVLAIRERAENTTRSLEEATAYVEPGIEPSQAKPEAFAQTVQSLASVLGV